MQSPGFATLFVLSRAQDVPEAKLDVSTTNKRVRVGTCLLTRPSAQALITRAVELGSKRSLVKINDQSGCLYT